MAGTKTINGDLNLLGKATIDNVPNSTGTVLTYNSTSKEVSTRTNAELISDLGLNSNLTAYVKKAGDSMSGTLTFPEIGTFIKRDLSSITSATGFARDMFQLNGSNGVIDVMGWYGQVTNTGSVTMNYGYLGGTSYSTKNPFRWTNDGRVGIGLSSITVPTAGYALHVAGNTYTTGNIDLTGNINSVSGELNIQKAGVNRFRTNGNYNIISGGGTDGIVYIRPQGDNVVTAQVSFQANNTAQFDNRYNLLFGTQTSAGSSIFHTGEANSTFGYGLWMARNLQFDGTNFIQPRGSLGSSAFTVNYHKGFSFNTALASGTNDSIVTLTEVAKIDISGNVFANTFRKSGGLPTQFLKADGSVDSASYYKENYIIGTNVSSTAVTNLDSYLPNGGIITGYGMATWAGNDRPAEASYGGFIKFSNYGDNNGLQFYYNNGHGGTINNRLWFRTKNNTGVTVWYEFASREWTTSQLAGYVTQSALNTQLSNYAKLNGIQTFSGTNTFSQNIEIPFATNAYHAVNLGQMTDYVDANAGSIFNYVAANYISNSHVVNNITSTNISNWTSAYNFTNSFSTNFPDLVAIENLTATGGYLRKDANNQWSLTESPVPNATATIAGKVKLGSDTVQTVDFNTPTSTASRSYPIQVNSNGQLTVNVGWVNSTYTDGAGLLLIGDSFNVIYGTTANTAAQGNDQRIINGNIAFGYGDHAQQGYIKINSRINPNSGDNLVISDDYWGNGERGLVDIDNEVIIAGDDSGYYKYGSFLGSGGGVVIHKPSGNMGYGGAMPTSDFHTFKGNIVTDDSVTARGFIHSDYNSSNHVPTTDGGAISIASLGGTTIRYIEITPGNSFTPTNDGIHWNVLVLSSTKLYLNSSGFQQGQVVTLFHNTSASTEVWKDGSLVTTITGNKSNKFIYTSLGWMRIDDLGNTTFI